MPESVRYLDERGQSPANARLYLQDYLRLRPPSEADLRDCMSVPAHHSGLFNGLGGMWKEEWAKRFPDSREAKLIRLQRSLEGGEKRIEAMTGIDESLLTPFEADLFWKRMRAYIARRNHLGAEGAENLLKDAEALYPKLSSDEEKGLLLQDRGTLLYDLGRYEEAARALEEASGLLDGSVDRRGDSLRVTVLLCETFLKLDNPRKAHDLYMQKNKGREPTIETVLIEAKIKADLELLEIRKERSNQRR
jgi:tetratricopeptide (TPR) repeat protein